MSDAVFEPHAFTGFVAHPCDDNASPKSAHDDLQSDDGSGEVLGALDFAFDAHDGLGDNNAVDGVHADGGDDHRKDKGLTSSIDWSSFQQQVSTTAHNHHQPTSSATHLASLNGPSVSGLVGQHHDVSALLPTIPARGPGSHSSQDSHGQQLPTTTTTTTTNNKASSPSPTAGDRLLRSTDSASHRKSPNVPLRSRNVYVAALPMNFSEADLTALLSEFGKVKSCRMFNSGARVTDIGRAYGFALFEEPGSAERAVAALDGKPLGNARIQCQLSRNGVVKKPKDVRERARITMANKEAVSTTTPSKSPQLSGFLNQSRGVEGAGGPDGTAANTVTPPSQPILPPPPQQQQQQAPAAPAAPVQQVQQPPLPPSHFQQPQQQSQPQQQQPPMLPHPGQLPYANTTGYVAPPQPPPHQMMYQQQPQQGMYMGGAVPHQQQQQQQQQQYYAQQQQQQPPSMPQMPPYMQAAAPPANGGAVPVMTPQGIVWMRAA